MFFIILAGLFAILMALVLGVLAYAILKDKKRSPRDRLTAVMLSGAAVSVLIGLPHAAYQAVIPRANDSNRQLLKTDEYHLQRIAPGQSVIVGNLSTGSSSSCTGYVFRDEDGNMQMIGVWNSCRRPGDDFNAVTAEEGNVDGPVLKVEWFANPAAEYDYGWFGIDFKMNDWESMPSYKKAVIEVPTGERFNLSDMAHTDTQ